MTLKENITEFIFCRHYSSASAYEEFTGEGFLFLTNLKSSLTASHLKPNEQMIQSFLSKLLQK